MTISTIGAQVVLDFDSEAARAARGAAADSVGANSAAWDVAMVAEGTNPTDPSGDVLDPRRPRNVDVPVLMIGRAREEVEALPELTCTQGNWANAPTSYRYIWQGVAGDDTSPTYQCQGPDNGKTVTVVVVAANGGGSTSAPPTNAVVITSNP